MCWAFQCLPFQKHMSCACCTGLPGELVKAQELEHDRKQESSQEVFRRKPALSISCSCGHAHAQEMMGIMVSERGGTLYSTDDRYCVDNGAMIAWPGLLALKQGQTTPFEETTCTQRFRTDDVLVTWRD